MLTLVIPLYRSEENLESLFAALTDLHARAPEPMEVVFVNDGSPDQCAVILRQRLPEYPFPSRLVDLSRNFGAFSAIAAGLSQGQGDHFAVLAADLQEPPELVLEFFRILLAGESDIVFGYRLRRADPWITQLFSGIFWSIYRRFVLPEIPRGGVDIFGCTRQVRDRLMELRESNTNLIALLFWLGFRRQFIPYERRERAEGHSAWTIAKKLRYAIDSIFNFTDLPIQVLLVSGSIGTLAAVAATVVVLTAWLRGSIPVLGYTPLLLAISFFGGLTTLGLGIVGQYLLLSLRNARQRPNFVIRSTSEFKPLANVNLDSND
jgi:glycosyltransferase involved in cell wall biosynthesis